uniref:Chloride intracellular channel 3 n=1 Tax=Ovis aries TaxID=9940 RepID=A0AC11D343_SHEEP
MGQKLVASNTKSSSFQRLRTGRNTPRPHRGEAGAWGGRARPGDRSQVGRGRPFQVASHSCDALVGRSLAAFPAEVTPQGGPGLGRAGRSENLKERSRPAQALLPRLPPWLRPASSSCSSRSPEVLKDFAPGSQLPILLCDGDAKTDTLQIEEFLEETLGPPEFPSLAPRYRESAAAGNDVFHKFSAFIKNPVPTQDDALYQQLLRALAKLDSYLRAPLEHELGREPQLRESRRRFLDGDQLTLADCGLLPKLHVVNTVCAHFRQAPIPAELRGVRRYLDCALQEKEFKYTCPHSAEILAAYRPVVRPR